MKKFILFSFLLISTTIFAQTNTEDCGKFLDLENGTLDGMKPSASPEEVKQKFPCFTGESEEGASFNGTVYNCGGGVFFRNHDFYCYTLRDYIEVRSNFVGETSTKLLGLSKEEVQEVLGKPDKMLTSPYENSTASYFLYDKKYGTLAIRFQDDFCTRLSVSYQKRKDIKLCW